MKTPTAESSLKSLRRWAVSKRNAHNQERERLASIHGDIKCAMACNHHEGRATAYGIVVDKLDETIAAMKAKP